MHELVIIESEILPAYSPRETEDGTVSPQHREELLSVELHTSRILRNSDAPYIQFNTNTANIYCF